MTYKIKQYSERLNCQLDVYLYKSNIWNRVSKRLVSVILQFLKVLCQVNIFSFNYNEYIIIFEPWYGNLQDYFIDMFWLTDWMVRFRFVKSTQLKTYQHASSLNSFIYIDVQNYPHILTNYFYSVYISTLKIAYYETFLTFSKCRN